MTNIKTVKTQAFGRELHYVLDPRYAAALTSLTGKKTINDKDIASLKTLGITVQSQSVQVATMVYAQSHEIIRILQTVTRLYCTIRNKL